MKILIIILFTFGAVSLNSQDFDKILTINIADDIRVDDRFLIKEIGIKGESNLSSYEILVKQAIDSMVLVKGNCVKIMNYQAIEMDYFKIKFDSLTAKIYKLENSFIDSLSLAIDQKKAKKSFWTKMGNKILDHVVNVQYYSLKSKQNQKQQFRDFFTISEEDSRKVFTYGYSLGLDYFIFLNGNITADYYFFNRKLFRMSINNKLGAMLQLSVLMTYDYPSIKTHTKVSKVWITSSVGPEFLRARTQYKETEKYTMTRFDFGVKWTTHSGTEVEISMPLRIDEGAIIPLTGINVNFVKGIIDSN